MKTVRFQAFRISAMKFHQFPSLVFLLAAGCVLWSSPQIALSQGEPQSESESPAPELVPVLIFNIASTERSLNDISRMFEIAGRPDMMEMITSVLGEKAGDLKGLRRDRPLGYMLFLEPTLPPRPRMVIYMPVENETDLINTLRLGPVAINEVGEHEYEIGTPGRTRKRTIKVQGDYAFMMPEGEGFLADATFPDPRGICTPLAARYDVSFTIRLRGIPPLVREVFSTFLTQQFTAQLQQRDNERDENFEARKARGKSSMLFLQQLIRDGEEVTIGIDSTEDGRRAVVELTIDARPESEFAQYLTGIAGKQSYFQPLLEEAAPLQISVSWKMDKRETEAALGYLNALRLSLKRELTEVNAETVDRFVTALEATVHQQHIDAILQFLKRPGNELVLICGFKVVGSETIAQSLKETVTVLKEREPEIAIALDSHQFEGISFHKLPVKNESEKWNQIYGRRPDLFVGSGGNTLWIGFGGDETLQALDRCIEVTQTQRPASDVQTSVPFSAILHASSWLQYQEEDLQTPQGELVKQTLNPENDSIRLEIVPTNNGARVAIRLDEGFVHLLGSLLAQLYDQTQL